MNKSSKLFVGVLLFFLYLPMTYFFGLNDWTKIVGVEKITDIPSIQEKSFKNKVFQAEFEKWWNSHFGFRNMLLKLKNSVYDVANFFVIHSGYSNTLIETKNGNLIGRGPIDLLLNTPCLQNTKLLKKKLFTLARNLEANDKKILFVLGSSKAQLYADELPKRFTFFENNKCNIFEYWENLLSSVGIECFNTQPLIQSMKQKENWEPYARTGTHWNVYSSIRVTQEVSKKLNLQDIKIDDVYFSPENLRGERDFANLLNVYWKYLPNEQFPKVKAHALGKNSEIITLVGDSYCGSIFDSLLRSSASDKKHLYIASNRLMSKSEALKILANTDVYIFVSQVSQLNDPNATMLKNIDVLLSVLPKFYAKGWLKTEKGSLLSTSHSYIAVPQTENDVELSFVIVQDKLKNLFIKNNGRHISFIKKGKQITLVLKQKDFVNGKANISFENNFGKIVNLEIKNIKATYLKPLTLGEKIYFSDETLPFQSSGFSFAEKWGRWTGGDVVQMSFALPEKDDYLFSFSGVHALVRPNNPEIKVKIFCKNRLLDEWNFKSDKSIPISLSVKQDCLSADNRLNLVFKITGAVRPIDIGLNLDKRKLAVGFHSLEVTRKK